MEEGSCVVLSATVSATFLATFSAVARYVTLCNVSSHNGFARQAARKIAQCDSAFMDKIHLGVE